LLQIWLRLPPNSPKLGAASLARRGKESQRPCLCSAGEPRWATDETPMGVGLPASLPPPAAGSLPRLGVLSTARVSQESQRARAFWRRGLVSHVAKLPGPDCEQVSAANLLGRAEKFATAQRCKCRPARRRKSDTASLLIGRGPSSAGGQTAAWPLRSGVVFYFRRLPKKFTTSWRFCHGVLFTTKFSPPFLVQRWVCTHAVG